jgi:hypothetical protein
MVKRGRVQQPIRVLLYGEPGVGKSTFAANAPSPIFIGSEDGTSQLDVARVEPKNWNETLEIVRTLGTESHEYQTIVIDTIDWLEPKLWDYICRRDNLAFKSKLIQKDNKTSIEAYGFGKGYTVAVEEWRMLLSYLDRLRSVKQMHVILLGHSHVGKHKNPEGDDYGRFTPKVHEKASGLIKEWCDAVLFARYEVFAVKDDDSNRAKAVGSGARVLCTEHRPAFDAKNRFGLPEKLPLSWDDFASGVNLTTPEIEVKATALRRECEALCDQLAEAEITTKTNEYIEKHRTNLPKLNELKNRLAVKLNEKGNAQ